jgi:uncharacterized protein (DUF2235 family)
MGRHLISLIDGTAVSASRTKGYEGYSNVYELAHLLKLKGRSDDGKPQVVFYTSGISSQPDTWDIVNLATGNSIQSQIVDQYTSICANFDFSSTTQQDSIYIFGFSRGAMAARALAGLISIYGLLHPRDIRAIPLVMEAWQAGRTLPDEIRVKPVKIEFVGIFDAVMGGVEWIEAFNPIAFPNHVLTKNVNHAVHLLSIDENRYFFRPKPWSSRTPSRGLFKQVWIPGVHSDIGGTGNMVWGRTSLLTMTHYLDRYTDLAIDDEWIRRKEQNLRNSLEGGMLFIDQHKWRINYQRKPIGTDDSCEYYHPVIDLMKDCSFNGRKSYDWRGNVFEKRFASLHVESGLSSYFKRVLKGSPKPKRRTKVSTGQPELSVVGASAG